MDKHIVHSMSLVRVLFRLICCFVYGNIFTSGDNETEFYFNYELETPPCLTPISELSLNECLKRFEDNLETTNIMVYQRRFLLCQLCFVTKEPIKVKQPGFIIAHKQIIDNSQRNWALGKPSNQSSTAYNQQYGNASSNLAVDGIWNTDYFGQGFFRCTHSLESDYHWWMVDLQYTRLVSKISILNRGDCCGDRFSNATITVGNEKNTMKQCGRFIGPGRTGELVNIICTEPIFGQYVKIETSGQPYLTLCEVAVYS